MQRVSLRRAEERVKGGVLFREREHPLWKPQRSAHLVEVHLIIVYRGTHQCGERSNAAFGKQSAAGQTSHAPHDSKARLQDVATRRRFMAKPCTPHPIPQAEQFFKPQTGNVGGRGGDAPRLSLGDSKGVFSSKREYPLWCCGAQAAPPPALAREKGCSAAALRLNPLRPMGAKKEQPFRAA